MFNNDSSMFESEEELTRKYGPPKEEKIMDESTKIMALPSGKKETPKSGSIKSINPGEKVKL